MWTLLCTPIAAPISKVSEQRIKNTNAHLQNANEIGGTNSTPPLATIKLEAIKIG